MADQSQCDDANPVSPNGQQLESFQTEYDPKTILLLQSCVRRWHVKKHMNSLALYYLHHPSSSQRRHRNEVWRELLKTERHYVRSLDFIVKTYKHPLEKTLETSDPIIPLADIQKIFLNIEEIQGLHREILKSLEVCASSFPEINNIGEVFLKLAPMLRMYTFYTVNFDSSAETLRKLNSSNKNQKWNELRLRAELNSQSGYLNLESFLIMPIQRIPRYHLLFQDLLKFTPEDHLDYSFIAQCVSLLGNILTSINEQKRSAEVEHMINKELTKSRSLMASIGKTLFSKRSTSKIKFSIDIKAFHHSTSFDHVSPSSSEEISMKTVSLDDYDVRLHDHHHDQQQTNDHCHHHQQHHHHHHRHHHPNCQHGDDQQHCQDDEPSNEIDLEPTG